MRQILSAWQLSMSADSLLAPPERERLCPRAPWPVYSCICSCVPHRRAYWIHSHVSPADIHTYFGTPAQLSRILPSCTYIIQEYVRLFSTHFSPASPTHGFLPTTDILSRHLLRYASRHLLRGVTARFIPDAGVNGGATVYYLAPSSHSN